MPRTFDRARRVVVASALVVVTIASLTVAAQPAQAATPYCGITWGSLPENNEWYTPAPIVNLRAGRHACFDRLVVDLAGTPVPGWTVEYVSSVAQPGSGHPVPLRGGAFLHVGVRAPAYDNHGNPTFTPPNRAEAVGVRGFSTFRQVHFVGSFEGVTSIGLGVRARLPFRVFALPGPGGGTRLIIDVAHYWS